MNSQQRQQAAALLQETNKFFDARFGEVDLDPETRQKLAAVGMDHAFEDWTKTWAPPAGGGGAIDGNRNGGPAAAVTSAGTASPSSTTGTSALHLLRLPPSAARS